MMVMLKMPLMIVRIMGLFVMMIAIGSACGSADECLNLHDTVYGDVIWVSWGNER